jgi:hypothetical protein
VSSSSFLLPFQDSVEIGDLVLVSSETESMEEEDLSYNAKVHIVAAGDLNKYDLFVFVCFCFCFCFFLLL